MRGFLIDGKTCTVTAHAVECCITAQCSTGEESLLYDDMRILFDDSGFRLIAKVIFDVD